MITHYRTFHPGGLVGNGMVDWPEHPGLDLLHGLLDPILGTRSFEHVAVLWTFHNPAADKRRLDMFVDETGALQERPVNSEATRIYRNNYLTNNPGTPASNLAAIHGPAVLFSRRVWF